ncbi:MAG: hypothetical protein ACXVCF_17895 [Isosphaeraceae bacterium]
MAYIDWGALVLIMFLLGWAARKFSRHMYRLAVLSVVVASVVLLTLYGKNDDKDLIDAFAGGSRSVIESVTGPIVPIHAHYIVAWAVLLVLGAGFLILFDGWSAGREQPQVDIPTAPVPASASGSKARNPDLDDRRVLTEELRFRLPAVYVRRPATMPGGARLDNLATIAEESEVKYGKLTAALMRLVHALEASPRIYLVRCFVERCKPDGRESKDGDFRRVSVDIQDARTGESVATHMLSPCRWAEASERVAGFAARQVFRDDPSTPAWAVGSRDGQDLSAYLLSREMCASTSSLRDLRQCRGRQRKKLENAVMVTPASGAIGYELAAMCDLDGDYLKSLLLHLQNRAQHPRFWAGRYRLAMSLSALAWLIRYEQRDALGKRFSDQLDRVNQVDLIRRLASVSSLRTHALLRRLPAMTRKILQECMGTILAGGNSPNDNDARAALLKLARLELRAYRRAAGTLRLFWNAFWHRSQRASLLQICRSKWRGYHPRRQRLTASIAIKIAERRCELLTGDAGLGPIAALSLRMRMRLSDKDALEAERAWALRRICPDRQYSKLRTRVPWQAAYNTACLFAIPRGYNSKPGDDEVRTAIQLLRLAVSDQDCDLEHPSEVIANDPAFFALGDDGGFRKFVVDLATRDFTSGSLRFEDLQRARGQLLLNPV